MKKDTNVVWNDLMFQIRMWVTQQEKYKLMHQGNVVEKRSGNKAFIQPPSVDELINALMDRYNLSFNNDGVCKDDYYESIFKAIGALNM
jgi:hypothetical protein